MNLVVQGCRLEARALKDLTTLTGAEGIKRLGTNAVRLIGAQPHPELSSYCEAHELDCTFVPDDRRLSDFRLFVTDMDSTLITIECIDEIHVIVEARRNLVWRGGIEKFVEFQCVEARVLRFFHPMVAKQFAEKRIEVLIATHRFCVMRLGHELEVQRDERDGQGTFAENDASDFGRRTEEVAFVPKIALERRAITPKKLLVFRFFLSESGERADRNMIAKKLGLGVLHGHCGDVFLDERKEIQVRIARNLVQRELLRWCEARELVDAKESRGHEWPTEVDFRVLGHHGVDFPRHLLRASNARCIVVVELQHDLEILHPPKSMVYVPKSICNETSSMEKC